MQSIEHIKLYDNNMASKDAHVELTGSESAVMDKAGLGGVIRNYCRKFTKRVLIK